MVNLSHIVAIRWFGIFLQILFISLILSLFSSGNANARTYENSERSQALNAIPAIQLPKKTLVVGSEQDYPPFSTGMTSATAGGFTVDLWKEVASEEDLNYSIRVLPFHQLLEEFKAGKIDVLINLAQSEKRQQFADFTVPHVIVHGAIFVRKDERRIHAKDDLTDKSIIVVRADLAHDYAMSQGWQKQLVLVNTAEEGLRLLSSGQHDAMLLSELTGMQTLQKLGIKNIHALKARAGFSQKFSFAVQKGQSDLLGKINEGLALTKSKDVYSALYEKWFGLYEVKEVGLRDLLKYLSPVVLIFVGILVYIVYRRLADRKASEKAMAESRNLLMTIINTAPMRFFWKDQNLCYLGCNQAFAKDAGLAHPDELIGKDDYQMGWAAQADSYRADDYAVIRSGVAKISYDEPQITPSGQVMWLRTSKVPLRDTNNKSLGILGVYEDITERKEAEQLLHIAATAFESQEGMVVTDANRVILRVNHAFSRITGYSAEEAIGQTPRLLNSGRHDSDFFEKLWNSVNNEGAWEGEIWNRRKNGEVYPEHLMITAVKSDEGIVTNYVAALTDITLTKAASDEIKNLAFYDPLTRLPNRRLLMDRLKQALVSSVRSGQNGALLFLDLDHFKTLNDTLGHDIGDLLLQQVASRLTSCVREGDTVARLGGDEFVVLLEDLGEQALEAAAQTEVIGNKILAALNKPYQLASHEHHSTPSVGATLFNNHKQGIDEILKQADIAMYESKTSGRNALRFFDPQMQEMIIAHASMEQELRKAIAEQQFQLHYQIQVDSDGIPLGAEALIRWRHPERGMISPAEFIPLAEETGLILPIGAWVLDTACAQLKTWQQNSYTKNIALSVNVSAKQFHQASFVEQVQATVARHGIQPTLLKLELTESMLLNNIESIIGKMSKLNEIGLRFELDDFGTGYSSLQYLKKLPLYQLKIDQSFVRDVATDASDKAIVRTIIAMAHSLNLKVIAEGVETEAQRSFLMDNGCNHYQGYLFSRPKPISEFDVATKESACAA
ncbi:MAG: EAL domain-containing protein [Pseudomonadota bacterium]